MKTADIQYNILQLQQAIDKDITAAKARQAARAAGREIVKDKVAVETIHELAHHHEDENLKSGP